MQSEHALAVHSCARIGPALTRRESRIMCLSLSESFSLFFCLCFLLPPPFFVEGHLKEVIPFFTVFPLFYLRGFAAGARACLPLGKRQKPANECSEAEGNSSMRCEIAVFYPTAVNSKIMPPLKALGDGRL